MPRLLNHVLMAALIVAAIGCSDGAEPHNGLCAEGGFASTDRYLPYDVGNSWRYQVTDLASGATTIKTQILQEEIIPDGETEPVIVQLTTKSTGSTENWTRVTGDAVLRFRQRDFDVMDQLEATTTYTPSRIRLDESAERIAPGAVWTESYSKLVVDMVGTMTEVAVTDQWTVKGVDEPCSTPFGDFLCLHLERVRTVGGIAIKDYWFAPGIGKVKETGGQVEELTDCSLM